MITITIATAEFGSFSLKIGGPAPIQKVD